MGISDRGRSRARLRGLLEFVLGSLFMVGVIAWGRQADIDGVVRITPGLVFPLDFLFFAAAMIGGTFALIGLAEMIAPGWLRRGVKSRDTRKQPLPPGVRKTPKFKKGGAAEKFLERTKDIDEFHPERHPKDESK